MGVVAQEEAGFETSERRPWARDDVGEARSEHVDRAGRARTDVIAVEVVAVRAGGAERDEDEGHDGEQEHKPEPEERGAEPQVHVAGRPAGRVVWSSSIAEPTKASRARCRATRRRRSRWQRRRSGARDAACAPGDDECDGVNCHCRVPSM